MNRAKEVQRQKVEPSTFAESVEKLGAKGVAIMDGYFDGKETNLEMIKYASKVISQTITVQNNRRVGEYQDRALALRLLRYLPADAEFRAKYIKVTQPALKPVLLGLPE
jgi:hypothetical protein